jgi:predicted KAP-like P-loop ATPase
MKRNTEKNQQNSHLNLLNDSPRAEKDLLNFARYAEPLAALIADPKTQPPLTIGIYGRWGTGKTTLMHQIRQALPGEGFLHVEFVPWLYGNEENLLVPLLHTIRDTLQENHLEHFKASAIRISAIITRLTAALTLKTLSVGQVTLKDIDDEYERYKSENSPISSSIAKLRDELRKTVKEITDEGKGRLIIYVDDLDRCLPGRIIELLESIKLFLDIPNTVILLAVDSEIVEYGIRAHYQDFDFAPEKLASLTADYLDKMVQLPIYLHPLEQDEMRTYLIGLAEESQFRLSNELINLLVASLVPNPRKIKRVLNLLALHNKIATFHQHEAAELASNIFARMVLLQQQWPDLYTWIRVYPNILIILDEVLMGRKSFDRDSDWRNLEATSPEIKKICEQAVKNISPQLRALFHPGNLFEGVDLRPHLQILG